MLVAFDESNPKYRCCCGTIHSVTGTAIFSLIVLFVSAVSLQSIYHFELSVPPTSKNNKVFVSSVALALVWNIVTFLVVLIGIKKKSADALRTVMVADMGTVIVYCAFMVTYHCSWNSLPVVEIVKEIDFNSTSLFSILILIFGIAFQLWRFVVANRCYQYFHDLRCSQESYLVAEYENQLVW